jgi:uncharacterized protein (DUF302 family)
MYGFSTQMQIPFSGALTLVTSALREEGFGVISEIDVQSTLKNRLGVDARPFQVLGVCNPYFSHQSLNADPDISHLLSCNVVVREMNDGNTCVSFMDPETLMSVVGNHEVNKIALLARERLVRVCNVLN